LIKGNKFIYGRLSKRRSCENETCTFPICYDSLAFENFTLGSLQKKH